MSNPLRSLADLMSQQNSYGNLDLVYIGRVAAAPTGANTTSGLVNASKCREKITIPAMTSPVTGAYVTYGSAWNTNAQSILFAAETLLGSLTVSGNTFTDGNAMPSRKVAGGSSVATAAQEIMIVVESAMTATTPVLTITYVNENGTGSRTATVTLPSNPAIDSAFRLTPHLQSGDYGIQDITNISISTGSAGVIRIYGLLPIFMASNNTTTGANSGIMASYGDELYEVQGGDVIGCYLYGNAGTSRTIAQLVFAPES